MLTVKTPPKHVLIAAMVHGVGGVETHLRSLCELLAREGAEVTFVSRFVRPNAPLVDSLQRIPVRVMATPFAGSDWARASLAWAATFWPLRLHRHFDVLYTLDSSWLVAFLAGFVKPGGHVVFNPIVMNEPGSASIPRALLDRRATASVSAFVCESKIGANLVREVHGAGVPVEVMPLLSDIGSVPTRHWHPHDELRVAFIGRYHRVKGLYRLLQLWPKLAIQPARLDFYGFGEEREALRQAVADRGLSATVQVNDGYTEPAQLTEILSCTDLLVLLSESEGVPVSLLEAMAHGVPFVATDVGGVRTLAEANPDVRVVPLDNAAIQQAIEEMSTAIRAGVIQGARLQQYHQSRYGYEHLSRKYLDALLNPERVWALPPRVPHKPYGVLASRLIEAALNL
ncbi:MAG: glycosyltransferase family 4 protein [Terriglobales bacterium]